MRRIDEAIATHGAPSKGQGKTVPMLSRRASPTPTKTTQPGKPTVAPTPTRAACGPGEHEYMGSCGKCPAFSTYVGNGKCRETMKIPRECSEYANPKPPACR